MRSIQIDGVDITLANPTTQKFEWIGQSQPQRELEACWLSIHPADLPLTPRLIGVPGVGKTTLAASAVQKRDQELYIMQCTADTRPEDLVITPVLSSEGKISYHASPLLTAVITGGIAILDEGNRMSEKSWASLAGLLDHRRSVDSIIAGITIQAHPEFRAVVTMNEDSSTFEIPDYIISRLQPQIKIGFPSREEELEILKYNIPFADEEILDLAVNFLQQAHTIDLPYSIRDGINVIRFTLKQKQCNPQGEVAALFQKSLLSICGTDIFAQLDKPDNSPLVDPIEMNLGDFYFDEDDDDINPDLDFDFPPDAS